MVEHLPILKLTYYVAEACGDLCWLYSYGVYETSSRVEVARFERCFCSTAEISEIDKDWADWIAHMENLGYVVPGYFYRWTDEDRDPCSP